MKQGDVQPLIKYVNDTLAPLIPDPLFVPFGITAPILTTGMTMADAFKGKIGDTESANADKTAANVDIENGLKKLRVNNAQFRLLITHYLSIPIPDPDLVNGFLAIDVIDDIGGHHSGLDGYVKDKTTGNFIYNATITNKGINKTVHSNSAGFYNMQIMPPGDTEFEVTAAGKKTINKIIPIKKGKMIDLDWEMENL